MSETERIKKAIKWLIGSGIAKTQEGIGLLMGYSNKSAFSQVVNSSDKRPDDFIARLHNLNSTLNKDWLLTGEGQMLNDAPDQPKSDASLPRLLELISSQQETIRIQAETIKILTSKN